MVEEVRSCSAWHGALGCCSHPLALSDVPFPRYSTESYPIYEPDFYWTLEFALPPLMELHQFGESPVIVDVQNRDPDADPDDHH